MPRRLVLVTRGLRIMGIVLLLMGAAAVATAAVDPERIRALLPPLGIDASAVGGALAALGVGCAALGFAHFVVVFGLQRRTRSSNAYAVVFCATLGMLLLAIAAAALVSAGRGPGYVLAAIALAVLALAYGSSAGVLIGQMRVGGGADRS